MCSKSKNTNRRPQMNTNFHFSPANNKYTNNTQIKNSQKAIEMKKSKNNEKLIEAKISILYK